MTAIDFVNNNKNKVLTFGFILLVIFAALKLYSSQNQQLASLEENKNEEIKKSASIESLIQVERKINNYKQAFGKKDLSSVVGAMTDLAKDTRVEVISIKPGNEQRFVDYVKSSFLIEIRAQDYHALGQFISNVENYKDLFFVEEVDIVSSANMQTGIKTEKDLDIHLKISTIIFL